MDDFIAFFPVIKAFIKSLVLMFAIVHSLRFVCALSFSKKVESSDIWFPAFFWGMFAYFMFLSK